MTELKQLLYQKNPLPQGVLPMYVFTQPLCNTSSLSKWSKLI